MPSGDKLCDLAIPGGRGGPHTVSFDQPGSLVAIGTMTGGIRHEEPHIFVFSSKDGKLTSSFRHDPVQGSIRLSPDGTQLASFSQEGELRFFEVKDNAISAIPARPNVGLCYRTAYSLDSRFLVAAWNSELQVFDASNGEPMGKMKRKHRKWTSRS